MTRIETFIKEMELEAQTTRKFLALVHENKYDWQPHEKSMTLIKLAAHVAELPDWAAMAVTTDELDFESSPYVHNPINSTAELVSFFDHTLKNGLETLANASEAVLDENWTLRSGETIFSVYTKAEVIRMAISQTIHHRAQLGVYFRLLNIPLPGSYGPTADDARF